MEGIPGWLRDFALVFVPLFVAMDPVGLLPFVVSFLGPMDRAQARRVVRLSIVTGSAIGLVFLAVGRGILIVLGISVSDFLIAGGIILLILALRDLISTRADEPVEPSELTAIVPIGTPLLVGPATISMLLLLTGLYGFWPVVVAFLLNMAVAWVVFIYAGRIARFLGRGGLQAVARVSYLLLCAIAVQLIRRGLADLFPALGG